MKGLLFACGLVIALFSSSSFAIVSIFDDANSFPPETIQNIKYYRGYANQSHYVEILAPAPLDASVGIHVLQQYHSSAGISGYDYTVNYSDSSNISIGYCMKDANDRESCLYSDVINYSLQPPSKSCPPDAYPNYTYFKDDDSDGQPDRCFNPMELDSASKCADAYNGGMNLEAGNNAAPTVCKTYLDGARCAFSKTVTQGGIAYYSPNLEQSCFGNDSLPEYDETPPSTMPGDEQCSPYGSGYVCAADPSNYCDAQGVCIDGCGYVNGQFACFRDQECTGDSCEPAPINCESSPDAAVCKDPEPDPDPEPCTGDNCDPTDPTNPGTGGGGSSFQLDYDRLINGIVGGLTDDSLTPDFKLTQDAINDANSALQEKADEFNDSSLFNSIEDTVSGNIFGTVDNMLPSGGTCTVFNWWGHTLDFCAAAEKVRSLLYFVFAFITFIYLRDLFYSTVTPRKE